MFIFYHTSYIPKNVIFYEYFGIFINLKRLKKYRLLLSITSNMHVYFNRFSDFTTRKDIPACTQVCSHFYKNTKIYQR